MKNEKLRLKKIARNKKRRKQRKKSCDHETMKERRIRIVSFFITGSRHGARVIRKKLREKLPKKTYNVRDNLFFSECQKIRGC
jgi:predicted metal-binding protein